VSYNGALKIKKEVVMSVSATTTPNTQNGIMALKKAMDVQENAVSKILDDSAQQQKQLEQMQLQRQQQAAMQTGLGINLNVTA